MNPVKLFRMNPSRKFVLIGNGGHALSTIELAQEIGWHFSGYVAPEETNLEAYKNMEYLGNDQKFISNNPTTKDLVLGVGFKAYSSARALVREMYESKGLNFQRLVSNSATISSSAILGHCLAVHQHAHIGQFVFLGAGTVVNTSAIVEHGAIIEADCHIAPGAVICGEAKIGEGSQIGANSTILPGVIIGKNVIIGAGAVVNKNVPSDSTVVGNPQQITSNR
jgi:UDP-perosamine 4-acetyltransferase